MKLKDLIRGKRADDSLATATHATVATNEDEEGGTVANVATVSVANPRKDETGDIQAGDWRQRVEEMLASNPVLKYAVLVNDAATDPVRVTVGVRGIAVFEMHIPHAHYDGLALLQVIEQHSMEETACANTLTAYPKQKNAA